MKIKESLFNRLHAEPGHMADHKFHLAIGELIKPSEIEPKGLPKSTPLKILTDKACASGGHTIPLYSSSASVGTPVELCNVDMLIEVGGRAKVIVEIEESNITPVHIFGKFLVTAFSDEYGSKESGRKQFAPPVLFIQILKFVDKPKSLKPSQWDHIADSIRSILISPLHERKWEYRLFQGSTAEFVGDGSKGKLLTSTIKEHLEQ